MTMTNSRIWRRPAFVVIVLGCVALARPAIAQNERPAPAVEFSAGTFRFGDTNEGFLGGDARFYLLPRLSLGPEGTWAEGRNRTHLMFTGNLTFDLLSPVSGQTRSVTPYIVVGGGAFVTRSEVAIRSGLSCELCGTRTTTVSTFSGGGGVRGRVGNRVIVGAEARVGAIDNDFFGRFNGIVGISLGK
jgi:hypothetical protein